MAFDLMHGTVPALLAGIVVIMISVMLAGRRSQHERHAGTHALRRMSYEELRPLLLMMLKRRGFELPPGAHHADRSHPDFVVLRGRSRYLVHTRFEPNDTVDAATIDRFATMISAQNADGGFLIGTCPVVATAAASPNTRLEVIDADAFWRELKPMVPDDLANEVRIEAQKHRRRRLQLAALAGVACAAAVYGITMAPSERHEMPTADTAAPVSQPDVGADAPVAPAEGSEGAGLEGAGSDGPVSTVATPPVPSSGAAVVAGVAQTDPTPPPGTSPVEAPASAATPAPAATAPPAATAAATPVPATTPATASAPANTNDAPTPAAPAASPAAPAPAQSLAEIEALTEQQRAERRAAAGEAVRAVANVASAEWSTKSTLIVRVPNAEPEVRKAAADAICPVLLRWEELRFTRLQVEDVTDGSKVSWRSCQ